tara:strand:+ start:885 stop:1139 length:255 start_codon:yes stop_codon:yes gene_type:complete
MKLIGSYIELEVVKPKQSEIIDVQEDEHMSKDFNVGLVLAVDKSITDIKPGQGVIYGQNYYGYHVEEKLYIKRKDILGTFTKTP